jgi:hypothetical protein
MSEEVYARAGFAADDLPAHKVEAGFRTPSSRREAPRRRVDLAILQKAQAQAST